jgi:hypothetical protein
MGRFHPRTITLRGRVVVGAELDNAFPLFSPEGERLWVPGWEPEILHPDDDTWREGQIFRTREEMGDAVWLITRLHRHSHQVEYHRIEPQRYVARVEVSCRALGDQATEASVTYSFVGLSEAGNREIAAMTQESFDAKMSRWTEWIARSLTDSEQEDGG